jgi:hypothetical protein
MHNQNSNNNITNNILKASADKIEEDLNNETLSDLDKDDLLCSSSDSEEEEGNPSALEMKKRVSSKSKVNFSKLTEKEKEARF